MAAVGRVMGCDEEGRRRHQTASQPTLSSLPEPTNGRFLPPVSGSCTKTRPEMLPLFLFFHFLFWPV